MGNISVLIIEDDNMMLELYKKVLASERVDVLVSDNGKDGIQIAKTDNPDIILLDIMMPGLNGFQVLDSLKSNQFTSRIPVVMISNLSDKKYNDMALKKGADDYWVKVDINIGQLGSSIFRILDKYRNTA